MIFYSFFLNLFAYYRYSQMSIKENSFSNFVVGFHTYFAVIFYVLVHKKDI